MKEYCCDIMEDYATHQNDVISYDPSIRSYSLILHNDPHGTLQEILFCPWCGTKLPKELGEEWERILIEEYGIEEPGWNLDKIPEEFKTDEWWKKRGL